MKRKKYEKLISKIKKIRIIILRINLKLLKISQKSKLMVLIIGKQFDSEKSEIL